MAKGRDRKGRQEPKVSEHPVTGRPRIRENPESYLQETPVWRFCLFDWDGPWGLRACLTKNWRKHIEEHLASFETMTWRAIETAAGGKAEGHGTNSHYLARDKFTRSARTRLDSAGIWADTLFSLRLENTVRLYGVRDGNCLKVAWFDPYHFKGDDRSAYKW